MRDLFTFRMTQSNSAEKCFNALFWNLCFAFVLLFQADPLNRLQTLPPIQPNKGESVTKEEDEGYDDEDVRMEAWHSKNKMSLRFFRFGVYLAFNWVDMNQGKRSRRLGGGGGSPGVKAWLSNLGSIEGTTVIAMIFAQCISSSYESRTKKLNFRANAKNKSFYDILYH